MTQAEQAIQRLMNWLGDDLYRERPHRGGYAMENPPGTIRVELEELSAVDMKARVKFSGGLQHKSMVVLDNPDVADLDALLP